MIRTPVALLAALLVAAALAAIAAPAWAKEQLKELEMAKDAAKAETLFLKERVKELNDRFGPWYYVISDDVYKKIGALSGGERGRLALAILATEGSNTLLLDEPTNHLDAESVAWLERFLQEYPGTVVAITHDRYFLDNVAGWILELDRGEGIPWQGNYSSWLEQKDQRLTQEEKEASARRRAVSNASGFMVCLIYEFTHPRRSSSFLQYRPA